MKLSNTALDQYCRRLGFGGTLQTDVATLQQLHALHPQAIAFENLDAWLGRPVVLEPDHVLDKLVLQQRGGYCFEHNLLFMRVLQTLGFVVQGLAARVLWNLPETTVLPRTHMLLLVVAEGQRWIVDVGFGGLPMTAALMLDSDLVQHTPHESFRISRESGSHLLQACVAGEWQSLYRFTLEPQTLADHTMANWYVSTHPESRFVSQLIAGRADSDGRHALLNNRYKRHHSGAPSVQEILATPADVRDVLETRLRNDTSKLPELEQRLAALFRTT